MNALGQAKQREGVRPKRVPHFLFAGVWLVFLTIPISYILSSRQDLGLKALALVALAAFAGIYLWVFYIFPERTSKPRRALSLALAGVTVCTVLTWPVLGSNVISLLPYFGSLLLFPNPIRHAPRILIMLTLLAGLIYFLHPNRLGQAESIWVFAGPMIGLACVAAGRYAHEYAYQEEKTRNHLAVSSERERIGRDVHDLLGHSLTVLTVKAQLAERLIEADPASARKELQEIQAISRQALSEVRSTVTELRSPSLSQALESARTALSSAGISVDIQGENEAQDTPHGQLFACVLREATTNLIRHSGARKSRIEITEESLKIHDDGAGLPESFTPGNGIEGIRSRVESSQGELSLDTPGALSGLSLIVLMGSDRRAS